MARAGNKNTAKLRKTSPTLASGAAEMNGAASAAFAGGKAGRKTLDELVEMTRGLDPVQVMLSAIWAPMLRFGNPELFGNPEVVVMPRPGPSLAEQFAEQILPRQRPPSKQKDRYKPKQALARLDLLKHFPPDGKVPDEMSTEAVRQRIGCKHSWDTVNRALGRELPKK
jgi:hypothetical protein